MHWAEFHAHVRDVLADDEEMEAELERPAGRSSRSQHGRGQPFDKRTLALLPTVEH